MDAWPVDRGGDRRARRAPCPRRARLGRHRHRRLHREIRRRRRPHLRRCRHPSRHGRLADAEAEAQRLLPALRGIGPPDRQRQFRPLVRQPVQAARPRHVGLCGGLGADPRLGAGESRRPLPLPPGKLGDAACPQPRRAGAARIPDHRAGDRRAPAGRGAVARHVPEFLPRVLRPVLGAGGGALRAPEAGAGEGARNRLRRAGLFLAADQRAALPPRHPRPPMPASDLKLLAVMQTCLEQLGSEPPPRTRSSTACAPPSA